MNGMFFDENTGTCICIVFSTYTLTVVVICGIISKGFDCTAVVVVVVFVPVIAIAEESIAKDCPPCFCPF